MPSYDYRCKACQTEFTVFYKTYADYDAAERHCPRCHSADLTRLIQRIAFRKPTRDYTRMSSGEMLSVLDGGDSRQVGELFDQVGGGDPRLGVDYHNATEKLLRGEPIDKVEREVGSSDG